MALSGAVPFLYMWAGGLDLAFGDLKSGDELWSVLWSLVVGAWLKGVLKEKESHNYDSKSCYHMVSAFHSPRRP